MKIDKSRQNQKFQFSVQEWTQKGSTCSYVTTMECEIINEHLIRAQIYFITPIRYLDICSVDNTFCVDIITNQTTVSRNTAHALLINWIQ